MEKESGGGSDNYRALSEPTSNIVRNDDSRSDGMGGYGRPQRAMRRRVLLVAPQDHALDRGVDWLASARCDFLA